MIEGDDRKPWEKPKAIAAFVNEQMGTPLVGTGHLTAEDRARLVDLFERAVQAEVERRLNLMRGSNAR